MLICRRDQASTDKLNSKSRDGNTKSFLIGKVCDEGERTY